MLFGEEFKLKYHRKSPKTTIFHYCLSGLTKVQSSAISLEDGFSLKDTYNYSILVN
jgi:hypothetical protein